ncbi:uncharacterized protein stg1 [Anabrus simplex]|uniref:uncharacterized protein stg1 n=1 Tax=Anabrus simplex TaxID=316456 RepID=UPI0035A2CABB
MQELSDDDIVTPVDKVWNNGEKIHIAYGASPRNMQTFGQISGRIVGKDLSELYGRGTGVRKGDGLSCILFNCVVEKIIREWIVTLSLEAGLKLGYKKDNLSESCIAFANDLTLLGNSMEEATHQLLSLYTGEKDMHCFNIDYFPREEYSPDPNDSTMAIPYAVTKSALFFILATLFLFVGEFCCLFGHFARQRRLFTFISGVVFIISGLLMLIGLVMYISIFKAEIGSKLRPRSQLQPPMFIYRYGFSFLLVVSGFMASEIAGTCAIFLYIYWHQKEWMRKRHEQHLHRRKLSSPSIILTGDHPVFPCRRHPYYAQQHYSRPPPPHVARTCSYISPTIHQRRFYLDSGGGGPSGIDNGEGHEISPCHSRSHQNLPAVSGMCVSDSMRDISVSASYYSFPPTAGPGYHHYYHHRDEECQAPPPPHHHREMSTSRSSFFPRDATTNTVSTTADINSCEGGEPEVEEEEDDYSPSMHHEHEFVTFDLDENSEVPPAPPARAMPGSEEQRRKEFNIETLRRTTPV